MTAEGLICGYGRETVVAVPRLELAPGTLTVILGPNGAGKSTLLRTLAGLQRPLSGGVSVGGDDLGALPGRERARRVAFLPQEEASVFPTTAYETVAIGREPYALGLAETPEDHAAIAAALDRVGMLERRDERLDRLSGGQRRRVLIARALAQETPAILLDEPAAHLDVRHAQEVVGVLRSLRGTGRTVVATFHEINLALGCADRVLVLGEGRVAFDGAPGELGPEALEALYGIAFGHVATEGRGLFYPRPYSGEGAAT